MANQKFRKPKGKKVPKIAKIIVSYDDSREEYSCTFQHGAGGATIVYTGDSLVDAKRHANTVQAVNSWVSGLFAPIEVTAEEPESFDTFADWFKAKLGESAQDIANHGADAGYPYISYTSDCVALYNEFESEIYAALEEDAESMGYKSVDELTATFRRSDMLNSPDQRKNLLLWYMVEREAREFVERGDHRS